MSNTYVLEAKDFFGEKTYYAGTRNVDDASKALQYKLEDGIAVSRRLNDGPYHYKVVRVKS